MVVLHIINSLKKGGAEGNLYRLCKFQKSKYKKKIKIVILTLIKNGFYEKELKKLGVKIFSLNILEKNNINNFLKNIVNFRKLLKKINPDIIQSWMYHSNFFTIFSPIKFYNRIFWNIRHSELNFEISKKLTIFISYICGFLSWIVPQKIIYCSQKSINFHKNFHFYCNKKTSLVYNGYDHNIYYNSKNLRSKFRIKNRFKNKETVLGYAGRYAKQKNIKSLLSAFSKLIKKDKNIYLCMVGKNINNQNEELLNLVMKFKIRKNVIFLGEQKNLLEFYNGIDLLVLTSHSESFPNVLAESMLCKTPVLSSDAGCAKEIINKSGFILDNNDTFSILKGLKKTLFIMKKKQKWQLIKKNARPQIIKNFSIEKTANRYFENWTL